MLRAVCFDLWDTLISDPPGVGRARAEERVRRIERALFDGDWGAPREAVQDAMQATVNTVVAIHQENRDVDADERIRIFYRHLDPSLRPEADLPAEAHESVRSAIHDASVYHPPTPLPGAIQALEELQALGLRLALVSNTGLSPGLALRDLLDRFGMTRFFTAQVYSDELQSWKPDPRMFDEAVFALGIAKEDVLFVGDTPEADILGAQSYGIGLTAQVGKKRVEGVEATLTLDGVHDLVAALAEVGHITREASK